MAKKKVYKISRSKHEVFDTILALNRMIPKHIPESMKEFSIAIDGLKEDYDRFYSRSRLDIRDFRVQHFLKEHDVPVAKKRKPR